MLSLELILFIGLITCFCEASFALVCWYCSWSSLHCIISIENGQDCNGMNLWILGVCVCLVRSFNRGFNVMSKCTIHFESHICKNKFVFSFSIVMHGFACIFFFSFLFLFFFRIFFSSLAVILVVRCCSRCLWAIFKGAYLPKKIYIRMIFAHIWYFPVLSLSLLVGLLFFLLAIFWCRSV